VYKMLQCETKCWHNLYRRSIGENILEKVLETIEDPFWCILDRHGVLLQLPCGEGYVGQCGQFASSGGAGDCPPSLGVIHTINLLLGFILFRVWIHGDFINGESFHAGYERLHELLCLLQVEMFLPLGLHGGLVSPPLPDPPPMEDVGGESGAEHNVREREELLSLLDVFFLQSPGWRHGLSEIRLEWTRGKDGGH